MLFKDGGRSEMSEQTLFLEQPRKIEEFMEVFFAN